MRILVSGHGEDRDALDTARRTEPYDKLILLSTRPDSRDLQNLIENERLAHVEVVILPVARGDLLGALSQAQRAFARGPSDSLVVHVAGGPNLITSALLLACFEHGVTAFYCHERGISRLPVIKRATFVDRFSEAEASVLRALLPGRRTSHEDLAEGIGINSVRKALLRLHNLRLVDADAATASLTATGEYYHKHLLTDGGSKLRGPVEQFDATAKASQRASRKHARDAPRAKSSHPRQGRRVRP